MHLYVLPFFLLGINPYYQGERVGFNPKSLWIAAGNCSRQRQAKLLGDWIVMAKKPKARSQPTPRYPSQGGWCPWYRINWDMMIEGKVVWYGRGFGVSWEKEGLMGFIRYSDEYTDITKYRLNRPYGQCSENSGAFRQKNSFCLDFVKVAVTLLPPCI